jgi:hypothetical protein
MLESFYIGGKTLNHHQDKIAQFDKEEEYIVEELPRAKRGKLWHGRPPVKIIEKYD